MSQPTTLFDYVARHARTTPAAVALRGPGGVTNYSQLCAQARQLAAALASAGVRRGDIVAVQLPNCDEFVLTLLALNILGATAQMVHMAYRQSELSFLLGHSGAQAYIGLSTFRGESPATLALAVKHQQGVQAADSQAALRVVVALGAPVSGALAWAELLRSVAALDSDDAINEVQCEERSEVHSEVHERAADEGYVLLYTSGTTADPKGVPIAHHRFLDNALASIAPLEVLAADVLLSAAPFTHLYGLFVLELALLAGASLSLLPAFTPTELVTTVVRDQCTVIFAGPAHFKPLLDQGGMRSQDFADVRFICLSGTAVPPLLARQVEARLLRGVVLQLWGMSELQAGSYGRPNDPPHIRLESAGRASPATELRIVDDQGLIVTSPQEGRLLMRGPSLFEGYLNNPGATAAAFQDGWFDTGDTARLTVDGALVITGRVKELINRGGVKFNPIDVESLLEGVVGVERCVLVPMPDPVLGERACAFVTTDGQTEVTLERLTQALEAAGIAKFKWPEHLILIAEMPLTPTQKVMRARLAADHLDIKVVR